MTELLKRIGDLISTAIDEVDDVVFLDDAMGAMCYLVMSDGRKLLLMLTDSRLDPLPLDIA